MNVFKIHLRVSGDDRTLFDMANTVRGEQTRAAIVEAALRLFGENGYEATTMRAIARGGQASPRETPITTTPPRRS